MRMEMVMMALLVASLAGCHSSGPRNSKPERISPGPNVDDVTYLLRERSVALKQLDSPAVSPAEKREAYARLTLLEHVLEQGDIDRPEVDYERYREILREAEQTESTVPSEAAPSTSSDVR